MNKKMMSAALAAAMAMGCVPGTAVDVMAEEEPVVITWYMPKQNDKMAQEEEVEAAINEVLRERVGAEVDFKFIDSGSYDEKMNTIISAGEEFDICFSCSWTNKFITNAQKGAYVDISEMLQEYGQDILAKQSDYVWQTVTVNGGIYGIPGQGNYAQSSSFVFKKDLVEKYDFDYTSATTLRDLEPYFETIKENEPGVTPVLLRKLRTPATHRYSDDSITGLQFDEDQQKFVRKDLEIYAAEDSNQRIFAEWYQAGYTAKDEAAMSDVTSETKTGKYAVVGDPGSYDETGEKSTNAYGYDCVETYIGTGWITNGSVTGAANAISITSKHPEKAVEVLNAIWADPELSNTIAYGIEGINYTVDEERSAEIGSKSVIPQAGDDQTWCMWHNFVGPLWDQWDSSWNRIEALEAMQADLETAQVGSTLGFYFDNSEFTTELASISSIVTEASTIFTTGSMPDFDEYLAEYSQRLTDAGLDQICEEANRQFEEWKAGK